jgi:hypothetical protein
MLDVFLDQLIAAATDTEIHHGYFLMDHPIDGPHDAFGATDGFSLFVAMKHVGMNYFCARQ